MRGNQGQYLNIRISYKTKSLYIQGHGHSIIQGNQKCDRCEDGDKQGASGNTIKVKYT